ncbi:hypothetical protein EVAR_44140_1 [Eumeta japonica]|uniref:YqaJ viral recombinase domain-containing protein n=1 Tax=Eumeta variegata TaxID=151549 RepID=A0A4C1XP70_EUMVA|nr:hypothetical protein EVAR_44140_1 [Eumeta japonica]
MEQGFSKANSTNLPRIHLLMLGEFLASNKDFCSAEFRNVKTSMSSRPSYGDDAVSYVQLKREGDICIVKCKVCPEHKVHAKLYSVTLIMDEQEEAVKSIECHDCVASQGGCKHAIAFLMWIHRRSEEPSCTSVECYWMKSKLSRAGSTLKYLTASEMSNAKPSLPSNTEVFEKFLEEGKKRRLNNCESEVDFICWDIVDGDDSLCVIDGANEISLSDSSSVVKSFLEYFCIMDVDGLAVMQLLILNGDVETDWLKGFKDKIKARARTRAAPSHPLVKAPNRTPTLIVNESSYRRIIKELEPTKDREIYMEIKITNELSHIAREVAAQAQGGPKLVRRRRMQRHVARRVVAAARPFFVA